MREVQINEGTSGKHEESRKTRVHLVDTRRTGRNDEHPTSCNGSKLGGVGSMMVMQFLLSTNTRWKAAWVVISPQRGRRLTIARK